MRPAGLSLDQAPPLAVPLRFFLTAPVFLLAAAAMLLWAGPDAFASRASPIAFAMTHLITLGFMAMVMLGAVMQMLPVLAAAVVPRARAAAAIIHAALAFGTAALAGGFLLATPLLLKAGAWLLGIAFTVFIAVVSIALARVALRNATVRGMTFAVAALVVTAIFGLMLAVMHAWGIPLLNLAIRALHPAWGLLGWTGLLVAGVAFQVVPMFQMTPQYPGAAVRWFSAAAFIVLVVWSIAAWYAVDTRLQAAFAAVLAAGYALFAVVTLALQYRRRRSLGDATAAFWRLGMVCAVAACIAWVARLALPAAPDALDIAIGALALIGFAGSIIIGMLYKIVPFLVWFHLQADVGPRATPHMKKILPDRPQRLHLHVHTAAVVVLFAATIWPQPMVYAAAIMLGASAVMLLRNLAFATLRYRAELARTPRPSPCALQGGSR